MTDVVIELAISADRHRRLQRLLAGWRQYDGVTGVFALDRAARRRIGGEEGRVIATLFPLSMNAAADLSRGRHVPVRVVLDPRLSELERERTIRELFKHTQPLIRTVERVDTRQSRWQVGLERDERMDAGVVLIQVEGRTVAVPGIRDYNGDIYISRAGHQGEVSPGERATGMPGPDDLLKAPPNAVFYNREHLVREQARLVANYQRTTIETTTTTTTTQHSVTLAR